MKLGVEADVLKRQLPVCPRDLGLWAGSWILVASLATGPLQASTPADLPVDLEPFERMGQALGSLSYEGVLVYSHEDRMETLRIQHRVVDGRVQATLESLSGQPRVVQQDGAQVVCRLSSEHLITVAQRALGQQTRVDGHLKIRDLAPYYQVQSQGQGRVAARQTQVMAIIPGDGLRYGYRFFLDTETGMPLKMVLLDPDTRIIEQIMFTSLTFDPNSSWAAAGAPPMPLAPVTSPSGAPDTASAPASTSWTFQGLPPGFDLAFSERIADANGNPMEHFVISDGLANISVYVESVAQEGLNGASRIGAIHAQGGKIAGHQVTVVGEAPAQTVAAVLSALRQQPESGG